MQFYFKRQKSENNLNPISRECLHKLHYSYTTNVMLPLKNVSCLENPMDRGAWRAAVHWVGHDLVTKQQQN